jgi:hypothetical protein
MSIVFNTFAANAMCCDRFGLENKSLACVSMCGVDKPQRHAKSDFLRAFVEVTSKVRAGAFSLVFHSDMHHPQTRIKEGRNNEVHIHAVF